MEQYRTFQEFKRCIHQKRIDSFTNMSAQNFALNHEEYQFVVVLKKDSILENVLDSFKAEHPNYSTTYPPVFVRPNEQGDVWIQTGRYGWISLVNFCKKEKKPCLNEDSTDYEIYIFPVRIMYIDGKEIMRLHFTICSYKVQNSSFSNIPCDIVTNYETVSCDLMSYEESLQSLGKMVLKTLDEQSLLTKPNIRKRTIE